MFLGFTVACQSLLIVVHAQVTQRPQSTRVAYTANASSQQCFVCIWMWHLGTFIMGLIHNLPDLIQRVDDWCILKNLGAAENAAKAKEHAQHQKSGAGERKSRSGKGTGSAKKGGGGGKFTWGSILTDGAFCLGIERDLRHVLIHLSKWQPGLTGVILENANLDFD